MAEIVFSTFSRWAIRVRSGETSNCSSIISQSINGSFAIRDHAWKLALCPGSGGWSPPRLHDDTTGLPEFQLYDLAADPGETKNLVATHPDRVRAMRAMLEEASARGRTTPGPDQPNDAPIVVVKPKPAPKRKAADRPSQGGRPGAAPAA